MTALLRGLEPAQEMQDQAPTASASFDLNDDASLSSESPAERPQRRDFPFRENERSETAFLHPLSDTDLDSAAPLLSIPRHPDIPPPRLRASTTRFLPLQKWEGVVISVQDDYFVARLIDKTSREPDNEAEIPLSDVTGDDLSLLQPGAIFYWTIGYSIDLTGSRTRASTMRFRRLPTWTKRELDEARSEADRTIKALGWEE